MVRCLSWVCFFVGCGGVTPTSTAPPEVPQVLSCEVDTDCVLSDYEGVDCCGALCGNTRLTTRAYSQAHQEWRGEHCSEEVNRCPVAKCPGDRDWTVVYTPVCKEGTCERSEAFHALANKNALEFLCVELADGAPEEAVKAPAEDKQRVMTEVLTQRARERGVVEWPALEDTLRKIPPDVKAAWAQASIQAHGLEEACASLTEAGKPHAESKPTNEASSP